MVLSVDITTRRQEPLLVIFDDLLVLPEARVVRPFRPLVYRPGRHEAGAGPAAGDAGDLEGTGDPGGAGERLKGSRAGRGECQDPGGLDKAVVEGGPLQGLGAPVRFTPPIPLDLFML